MPKPNFKLLDQTTNWLRKHPEQHDQLTWGKKTACGTTCCIAGTVVVRAGYELKWEPEEPFYAQKDDEGEYILSDKGLPMYSGGREMRWEAYATTTGDDVCNLASNLLNLNRTERDELFLNMGNVYSLEQIIDGWRQK